jgi:hypothetical protein
MADLMADDRYWAKRWKTVGECLPSSAKQNLVTQMLTVCE